MMTMSAHSIAALYYWYVLVLGHYTKTTSAASDEDRSKGRQRRRQQQQVQTVADFCSNLGEIETFVTERRLNDASAEEQLLSEDENYVCSCFVQPDSYVYLECSTFTMPDIIPVASIEYMRLIMSDNDENEEIYVPESVGRCEYLVGTFEGPSYCEDYILDATTMKYEVCFFAPNYDISCDPGARACVICEDGQTVSFTSPEDCVDEVVEDVTCAEGYSGSYLFEYHIFENPIYLAGDEPVICLDDDDDDDAPTVDEFCQDEYLSDIERNLTQTFRGYFPEVEIVLPYECSCVFEDDSATTPSSLTLLGCAGIYREEGSNRTHRSTETMGFEEQKHGYVVPTRMQWCDFNMAVQDDFYCEFFDFAYRRNELSYCEIGGCGAAFCELCVDGTSVAHTCFSDLTCSQRIPGAYLFAYKDVRLAAKPPCVPTDDDVIGDTPTTAPTTGPDPTSDPTVETTDFPSGLPSVFDYPTNRPSISQYPSGLPSISQHPTVPPSISQNPSDLPSISQNPTELPSISMFPSSSPFPSENPTLSTPPSTSHFPSDLPSMAPSMVPSTSQFPSDFPSMAPSVVPTVMEMPPANPTTPPPQRTLNPTQATTGDDDGDIISLAFKTYKADGLVLPVLMTLFASIMTIFGVMC